VITQLVGGADIVDSISIRGPYWRYIAFIVLAEYTYFFGEAKMRRHETKDGIVVYTH